MANKRIMNGNGALKYYGLNSYHLCVLNILEILQNSQEQSESEGC